MQCKKPLQRNGKMCKVQVPMNAPYSVTGVNRISLTAVRSATFPTWELTCARNLTTSLMKGNLGTLARRKTVCSPLHGPVTWQPRWQTAAGLKEPARVTDGPGDTPTVPRGSIAGGDPHFPGPCPPRQGSLEATAVPIATGEATGRPGRNDRHLARGQLHEETHPRLPSTLTQASVSPPYSWARPPPSTRTWPPPGRARPSPPPGSMALAGGPSTQSPGRRRLRSWPRGSAHAHAQLLRPAGGTHCRTPVAKELRAVSRPGCGGTRAAAVAELLPEATEPVPSASAATALRSQQPRAPPPAFRCRSLGNHLPKRYFRVGPKTLSLKANGGRIGEGLARGTGESIGWEKWDVDKRRDRGGTFRLGHPPTRELEAWKLPLPACTASSAALSQSDSTGLNFHSGWARCTLWRVVPRGARAVPAILPPPAPCSQPPYSVGCRVPESPSALYPSSYVCFSLRAGRMRLRRPQISAAHLREK